MSLFYAWLIFWLTMHSRLEVIFLQSLESFLHCLLASSDAGEKSEIILIPDPLHTTCFSFVETCRILLLFWNFCMTSFDVDHCDLWCWTSSGPIQSRFMFFNSGKFFWTSFWCFLPLLCLFFFIFQKIYSTFSSTFLITSLIPFLLLCF